MSYLTLSVLRLCMSTLDTFVFFDQNEWLVETWLVYVLTDVQLHFYLTLSYEENVYIFF